MRIVSLLLLRAAVVFAYQVMESGGGTKDGVGFRYETRVEPRIEGQKVVGFAPGGLHVRDKFHRYLRDKDTRRYVGYDVTLSKQADGTLLVTLGQLSLSAEKLGLDGEWTQVPLAVNSTPQTVKFGDEMAIDLFTHPATGQKIVDHLFFVQTPAASRLPEGSPRDFTIDDVPLTLNLSKISLNGELLQETANTTVTGESVYFYLPGHGRYAMSLTPNLHLGFRKLGEARGARITFRHGNDSWSIDSNGPVAPGDGVFNLYVYADPTWRPSTGADRYQFGASSARSMVRK